MTQQDISEMNRTIAEFMGWEKVNVGYFGDEDETEWQRINEQWMDKVGMEDVGEYYVKVKDDRWIFVEESAYHSDWNWLMPVVEKIDRLAHVTIRVGICSIDRFFMNRRKYAKDNNIPIDEVPPIAESNEKDFIGNVHQAVYDFITWYNTNNK